MGYWNDYPRQTRRKADGIKAKSQRGKFGQTWWAGQWLAALDRLVDTGRLSRGRSYARSGQVLNLDVSPEGVKSRVQGSRATPYNVTIRFQALSDEEWDRVADAMASEAIYAAKLLAGEMPQQIEEAFETAGTHLFPATGKDLITNCSCPDWANPCKHVAAVYYLLGERFDEDPFLIFLLRGRSKEEIAAALRARRTGGAVVEDNAVVAAADKAAAEVVPPLEDALERFWSMPSDSGEMAFHFESPPIDALPVKQRGKPAFWISGLDFTTAMEDMYRAIERQVQEVVMGEDARNT
jgi:uncharacterized Zn finger protein